MVYIVSDERIAVENFEQGKIYKVVFVDESILYGVCIGIGSDFVMLSGDISGYIFLVTMQTASQVSSIDLYDPTPPEPPVPWTNLLQYQTGVPPFEFPTTDTSLFSWYIEGECGDRTKNLFDISKVTSNTGITNNGDGTLTVSSYPVNASENFGVLCPDIKEGDIATLKFTTTSTANLVLIRYYEGGVLKWSENWYSGTSKTITAEWLDARVGFYRNSAAQGSGDATISNIMINTGLTTLPYEPYGYKIPVICNNNTTNIYLDAPLSEGEILYSTDIDTAIVTDIGENELTVGTTQQPTSMQIVYKIADR